MEKKNLIIEAKRYKGESAVISARLPIELIKVIDDAASQTGKTRNEILLTCLEFATENLVITKKGENK